MSTGRACVVLGNIATWSNRFSEVVLETIRRGCAGVIGPPPVSAR
jgi:hypothetical protein